MVAKIFEKYFEVIYSLVALRYFLTEVIISSYLLMYEGNSISKLQIQVATYVFELSAGNCHR